MPGLYSKTDSRNAEPVEQISFARRHASGIGFDREFVEGRQVEYPVKPGQQKLQLIRGQSRRCSATQKNGVRDDFKFSRPGVQFGDDCLAKAHHLAAINLVLVKCAVGANPGAEWDMNVEM